MERPLPNWWSMRPTAANKNAFLGLEYRVASGHRSVSTANEARITSSARHTILLLLVTSKPAPLWTIYSIVTEEDFVDFTTWPEPIGGPDGALFEYSVPREAQGIARRLHFKSAPDFENPMDANRDNVYEVSINVVDTDGATGSKSIRITVLNVNEDAPKLTLAPAQPHRGSMVEATLTDPDGIVTITDWMWASATTTQDSIHDSVRERTHWCRNNRRRNHALLHPRRAMKS